MFRTSPATPTTCQAEARPSLRVAVTEHDQTTVRRKQCNTTDNRRKPNARIHRRTQTVQIHYGSCPLPTTETATPIPSPASLACGATSVNHSRTPHRRPYAVIGAYQARAGRDTRRVRSSSTKSRASATGLVPSNTCRYLFGPVLCPVRAAVSNHDRCRYLDHRRLSCGLPDHRRICRRSTHLSCDSKSSCRLSCFTVTRFFERGHRALNLDRSCDSTSRIFASCGMGTKCRFVSC
jgi:hypothetical protein